MSATKATTPSTRRHEILVVAARVFADKGIMNATVRDIGQEAGILSGSLYHHFESKDQMIEEVLRPVVDDLDVRFGQVADTVADPLERIRQVMLVSFAEAAQRPEQALIFRNDAHHFAEIPRLAFVETQRIGLRTMVVDALCAGQAQGRVRPDLDPEVGAVAVFDLVFGSTRWLRTRGEEMAAIGQQLTDVFLAGIAPR